MASLKELGVLKEKIDYGVDNLADMPEQMGMRPPFLQPGSYEFKLPGRDALDEAWDKAEKKDGDKVVGVRPVLVLREAAALTILRAPAGPDGAVSPLLGKTHNNRVSGVERKRGRMPGKGEPDNRKEVSDLDYLLQALGEEKRPKTFEGYVAAVLKHATESFGADVELNWSCNPNKPIRVTDETSGQTITLDGKEGRENQVGCGERYYEKDVRENEQLNEDGTFPQRITCACGALLYANENLVRFRAAASAKKA